MTSIITKTSRLLLVWSAVALAGLTSTSCSPTLGTPPEVCSTEAVNAGESEFMEPGGDCISCHSSYDGPTFTFAGTVMNALGDDQNCRGREGIIVRITDADGAVTEMTTNSSGNFYSKVAKSRIKFPFRAEVSRDGAVTAMLATRSETETDCASCHTATGTDGAPGRILAP